MLFANALANGLGQVIIFAAATIVAAAVTSGVVMFNRHRKTTAQKIDRMYIAMVGEEVTPTNPSPSLGFLKDLAEQKRLITDVILPAIEVVKDDVREIRADHSRNGGSTTRDAVARIEDVLGSDPQGLGAK